MDTFNLPYYAATEEEVQELIEEEGSFTLRKLESFKSDWDTYIRRQTVVLMRNRGQQ